MRLIGRDITANIKTMKSPTALIITGLFCVALLAGCKKASPAVATDTAKDMIASHDAAPLSLTTNYTTPASYFDSITRFPAWKTVPRGPQVFDGVPLDIEGMICLWGEGNATKLHIIFPEARLGIAMNKKFDTLYVYHGCFFTSDAGTPVCAVVFRYADGTSVTNQMLYGDDFIDWMTKKGEEPIAGPTAERSRLAWVGGSSSTNSFRPLRLCLTAIENPQPTVEVTTVDLYSLKSRTAACIMAMTPGKAGLMK